VGAHKRGTICCVGCRPRSPAPDGPKLIMYRSATQEIQTVWTPTYS